MEEVTWEGMTDFLEQNHGLILTICKAYKIDFEDTIHLQEDAYVEAVKSYNLALPSKKYNLVNHFCNLLKSKIKQELAQISKTVYLEDMIVAYNEEGDDYDYSNYHDLAVNLTGKQWRRHNEEEEEEENKRQDLIMTLQIRGNGHFKEVVSFILMNDYVNAISVMPECRDAILEIAKRRDKRQNGKKNKNV